MAKDIKNKDNESKTWIMTVGVVFDNELNKESAMREFQQNVDECLDDYRMIEVLNAKEGSLNFKIVEDEL
jgi:hypothetical protein